MYPTSALVLNMRPTSPGPAAGQKQTARRTPVNRVADRIARTRTAPARRLAVLLMLHAGDDFTVHNHQRSLMAHNQLADVT